MIIIAAFCLGFSAGAAVMWWHFHHCGLIRSREEWMQWAEKQEKGME